ncbi:hypothetical protein [Capnocytophaga sputigena]|uniref:hypothetical protein n=1 Tax=Capnocytophaga sputigena TaxID=1019 RepID=UPI000F6D26B4|nr:hypothetical protein [Capnocytophaga sputigena]VEI52677.1 Uncharacterised protein [Capnocytophaga sputigena]
MNFTEKSLNELLNGGYEKAVGEDKNTFIAFYAYLFDDNDPCTTCGNKLSGYWNRLVNEGNEKLHKKLKVMARKEQNTQDELQNDLQPKEAVQDNAEQNTQDELQEDSNEPCKFRLRSGITSLAIDFGSSELFNNDTLTNDIALRYLKINPNRIANFDLYPDNWEALIGELAN